MRYLNQPSKTIFFALFFLAIFTRISAEPNPDMPKPSRCYVVSKAGDTTWAETDSRKKCPQENRDGSVVMDKKKFEDPIAFGTLDGHYFKFRNAEKSVPRHKKAYSAYAILITDGRIRVYKSQYSTFVWTKTGSGSSTIRSYDETWTAEFLVEKDNSKSFKAYNAANLKQMMRDNPACMKILNKYEKGKKKKLPFLIGGIALAWAGAITAVAGYLVYDKKLETDPDAKFPIAVPVGAGVTLMGAGALVIGIVKYKKNEDLLSQAIDLYNKK